MPDAATNGRWGYVADIGAFLSCPPESVLGALATGAQGTIEGEQRDAWLREIQILKRVLQTGGWSGRIYFEFLIPRIGRRVDVILVIEHVVFTLEFKVGESSFGRQAIEQAWDYALDLKNFHESSHDLVIIPILVATEARPSNCSSLLVLRDDKVADPLKASSETLLSTLEKALEGTGGQEIDARAWEQGRYLPTPTIVEAAKALYAGHSVEAIARQDAGATNLALTAGALSEIIGRCRDRSEKAICFVTGVPGAGKTLVGLDVAHRNMDPKDDLFSVYLSGNAPLVAVLQEALARDECQRNPALRKGEARSRVKAFIQNVHHFRDAGIEDDRPVPEHVALFDEAQRAWNLEQTASFMSRKKNLPGFNQSEPEFLISCLDRHEDWATVVCLVGGGQEINTGEGGISEWLDAIMRSFPSWKIYMPPELTESEYQASERIDQLRSRQMGVFDNRLHLAVSMRSFRATSLSAFVRGVLELEVETARSHLANIRDRYPLVLTRDIAVAKEWLRSKARGSERYGIVVSSQAFRLKPHAIDVRPKVDPVHWFLHEPDDIRSSCFMEDVATEFQVQGLELDWTCVVWDADFRLAGGNWDYFSFKGSRWQRVRQPERRKYLKNAYRVLLSRARQGMVIVVPEGNDQDPTRPPRFYDETFEYLRSLGIPPA